MTLIMEGEAKLYCGCELQVEVCSVAGGTAAVYSARCPGKETPNEDAAGLFPVRDDAGVLAVADGVGGGPAGADASRLTLDALGAALVENPGEPVHLRTAILNGIENANRDVQGSASGAATTLAAVEIRERTVRPYHVGDSIILVIGQRGKVKLQTICHSPVGFAVESGLLDALEAMHHEDRHLVSNVIGAPEMRIEIGPTVPLAPKDTVLLASDGLLDNLHLSEIVDHLRKGSLESAVEQLAAASRRRMTTPEEGQPSKPDDMTIVAFRMS